MDAATERQINNTIDRAVQGRTVVSVTHRLTAITDYDHIVVLVDGAVESQGTHAQLLAEGGMYARLWSEQTGTPMPQVPVFNPIDALVDLPHFRTAEPSALLELVSAGRTVRFDTGASATSPAGGLAILLDGRAELTNPSGERIHVSKGDVIGTGSLLDATEATAIHATEPVELLMLDRPIVAPFIEDHTAQVSFTETVMLPASSKTLVRAALRADNAPVASQPVQPADVRATMRMTLPRSET